MGIGLSRADGGMELLFSRYQRLPSECSRVLTTYRDGQNTLLLKVYQGDSDTVAANSLLGTFLFSDFGTWPRAKLKSKCDSK